MGSPSRKPRPSSPDPLAVIVEDDSHPENARVIGESLAGRVLLVVFVEREQDLVRLISARRATRHERRRHEEGAKGK